MRRQNYLVTVLNHIDAPVQNHGHYDDVRRASIVDSRRIREITEEIRPSLILNLAARSSVAYSWKEPEEVHKVNALAVEQLLLELNKSRFRDYKFFQAGSTDMVGKSRISSDENSFSPWSPYGNSKVYAWNATKYARDEFGIWAVNGILTNHDSRFRDESFVIPMIAGQIFEIMKGERSFIEIRDPEINRDWAHAFDMVTGIFQLVQQDLPFDWVLATGESKSLRELVRECEKYFNCVLPIKKDASISTRIADFPSVTINARQAQDALSWYPKYLGAQTIISLVESKLSFNPR